MMKNPYYNWRQSKAVAVVVAAFSLLQEQSNGQYTLVVVSWDSLSLCFQDKPFSYVVVVCVLLVVMGIVAQVFTSKIKFKFFVWSKIVSFISCGKSLSTCICMWLK